MSEKDPSGGMESRGVTRPMAEKEIQQQSGEHHHGKDQGHHHTMSYEQRLEQLHRHLRIEHYGS